MPNILDHAKAVATGGDAERIAGRREVRKKLAPLLARQQQYTAIREQLRAIDARESKTVAAHEKTTAPLQETLLEIEASVTDSILKDEPIDDKIAKKRVATTEKIATANSKLEAEVEAMKKLRDQYQVNLRGEAGTDREIQNLRGELKGRKLGSPKLLERQFVNQQAFKWACNRLNGAEEGLRDAVDAAKSAADARQDDELPSDYELQALRELKVWNVELDEASAIKEQVLAEKYRLRDLLEKE